MRVHFLGTGSAEPSPIRKNTSLLIETGSSCVLIDCSSSPAQSILQCQVELESVTSVVLTHTHIDHIYGLPSLIHGVWLNKGVAPGKKLKVYGQEATLALAKRIVEMFELETKRNAVEISWHLIDSADTPRHVIMQGISGFDVTHAGIPTIGISIETEIGRRLTYSCDCTIDDDLIGEIRAFKPDILIQDCGGGMDSTRGHAGAIDIAEMLKQIERPIDVYLVHVPPLSAGDESEIIDCVRQSALGEVIIPNDSDNIDL